MSHMPNQLASKPDESPRIRVLVVHPQRVERVRLIRPLRAQFGRNVEVLEASDASEAFDRLDESFFDVALVARSVGDFCGLDLAALLVKLSPETATILVADEDSPALTAEVAQSAACDYVVRGQFDERQLAKAISGAIRQIHLQCDYQETVRRMNQSHDQMDHLIRALSHDMNANFMLMESSFSKLQRLLESQPAEAPDLKEIAAHVRACMTESRRFLNDLVGLARTGRVEMEPELADTDGVIEEVLFEQRELIKGRQVQVAVGENLPRLWCNRHRLKQIVTNLVRNAIKHGTDPDRPKITVTGQEQGHSPGTALLCIGDNGPGIPEEWREEIFMPGRRLPGSDSEGTGMGLAIVRKIVQHYGGDVRVVSGPEGGALFEIELPSIGMPTASSNFIGTPALAPIPEDRRLDHDTPHDDPRLHPHRAGSRRTEPDRRFLGSGG